MPGDIYIPLKWRHNGYDGVSNHQLNDCLLKRLFRRRSKKASKLRVNGLCVGNSPVTGEFPAQMASNAENVSIWWRHRAVNEMAVIMASPLFGTKSLPNTILTHYQVGTLKQQQLNLDKEIQYYICSVFYQLNSTQKAHFWKLNNSIPVVKSFSKISFVRKM